MIFVHFMFQSYEYFYPILRTRRKRLAIDELAPENGAMRQVQTQIEVATNGRGLYEVTGDVVGWTREQDIMCGLLTVYCRHTSASLTIQENADPDVMRDLEDFFQRLVTDDPTQYRHTAEGPDDMPAHIRAALTDVSLNIPINDGRPVLGTWQGIYLFEHRIRAHARRLMLHLVGA